MTNKAKVHGLVGDWVEPDWPLLTLSEVDEFLRRFPDAGGADRILFSSPRPFSAASVVETRRGNVFVKRHHQSVRDREGLLEEHRLMQYLRSQGGCVPKVLADKDGETAIQAGDWTYELHSVAEGLDIYEQALSWTPFYSTQQARSAGRAMAQLHQAAEGYDAPLRKARSLVQSFSIFAAQEPWPVLEKYVAERPVLADYLAKRPWREQTQTTLMPFYNRLQRWLGALRPLWTHNDLHASNFLWSKDSVDAEAVSVIDFGLSDRTNAVQDIATAIERNAIEWLALQGDFEHVVHLDQIDAILEGYEQVRPLSDAEARAIPAMLPLVHAEFALSEADYFLSILKSEEKASVAWDGYFLAHAAWYRTDSGKRLLAHLEAWADGQRRADASATARAGNNVTA